MRHVLSAIHEVFATPNADPVFSLKGVQRIDYVMPKRLGCARSLVVLLRTDSALTTAMMNTEQYNYPRALLWNVRAIWSIATKVGPPSMLPSENELLTLVRSSSGIDRLLDGDLDAWDMMLPDITMAYRSEVGTTRRHLKAINLVPEAYEAERWLDTLRRQRWHQPASAFPWLRIIHMPLPSNRLRVNQALRLELGWNLAAQRGDCLTAARTELRQLIARSSQLVNL